MNNNKALIFQGVDTILDLALEASELVSAIPHRDKFLVSCWHDGHLDLSQHSLGLASTLTKTYN
jgi:hypothetical protein